MNSTQAHYDIHMFFGSLMYIANLNIKHMTAEFLTINGNFIHWGTAYAIVTYFCRF
jgi:hypothetical protein